MDIQGNDVLYNDLPTWNWKKEFETYNDKTWKEMKMCCWNEKGAANLINQNSELVSMKPNYSCCCLNTKETMLKEIQKLQ